MINYDIKHTSLSNLMLWIQIWMYNIKFGNDPLKAIRYYRGH